MSNRTPAEVFPPGEFIRDELSERGWTQSDLAKIMERPVSAINLIISGKKSVTPETAVELAEAFGTSPEFWLNLETAYRLSRVTAAQAAAPASAIRERAILFESAPVKDMEKRGWLKVSESIDELKHQLSEFFSLPEATKLRAAAKSSIQSSDLTPEQVAWCVRALQLAKVVPAQKFSNKAFDEGIPKLRALADFPENVRHVPKVLSEMGIRFVVVEHLPKSKIDGAALWLGDGWEKPVIALSVRYDRIDSFWHTLFHECSHIKNRDSYVIDVDIVGADRCLSSGELSEIEARANEEASEMLIPKDTFLGFIKRTRPFYYSTKIIQFANLIKLHPGIIAGALQHKGEIDWSANRHMLVKVRDILISGAVTDGWGVTIAKAK
jgi:HTH-type transcriptional regulator / antitoxin HigA